MGKGTTKTARRPVKATGAQKTKGTLTPEEARVVEFLTTNRIGTLATVDSLNQPHATTMYFVIDPDLTVYFITKEETTKCHNLQQNPKAALAVHEANGQATVQLSGTATLVEDLARIEDIYRRVSAIVDATSETTVPPFSKISGGRYRCFCLKPHAVRLAEYGKSGDWPTPLKW
jgi:nitroimidazol reductase NimA-like FMN-containing flavoprotein (pyridoxamine 5'-phosphate oxidase superfamily)